MLKTKASKSNSLPKAVVRHNQEEQVKPYQAELIKMQQYLEAQRRGMIILFEGRDAAGKGGTIRRVTRYINEKRYRVVALGKPMLKRTSTYDTPWIIIRSNDKHKARLNAMKVILNAVPYENRGDDLDFVPDPKVVVSAARELELMEAQRMSVGKFVD